jgi:hypothetical protein
MRITYQAALACFLLFPALTMADHAPLPCPDVRHMTTGIFYLANEGKTGYSLTGYFDVDHDIYSRWGLEASSVLSGSVTQVLNDANAALLAGKIDMLSTEATCWDGNRGSLCVCTYQIEIPYEYISHIYTLEASILG